jgi:hypothetical protein
MAGPDGNSFVPEAGPDKKSIRPLAAYAGILIAIVLGLVGTLLSVAGGNSTRVDELERQLRAAQERIAALDLEVASLRGSLSGRRMAYLEPSSPGGYAVMESNTGSFPVALRDVQPHLDGYKVTLDIGNLSSATYQGFTLKAEWGKDPFGVLQAERKDTSLRQKEFALAQSLLPGTWNRVHIVIPSTKPEEFKFLRLSITTDVISLRTQ